MRLQMKEKVKKVYQSDLFPMFLFLALMLCIEMFMTKEGDDIFFSSACNNKGLINYLLERYHTWTSRIVIEAILVTFSNFLPMVIWKIANLGMYALLIYSMQKLFVSQNKKMGNAIICIFVLLLPFSIFHEAGWIATFNNYLWVVALGMYSFIAIHNRMHNKKIPIWQAITFILAIIYAANQEQMAGILFLIYTPMILYMLKIKKVKPLLFIMYAIIIVNLVFILTCPGNTARTIEEASRYYQNFEEVSLITKLEQGLTSMMYYVMERWRILFVVLLVLIAYAMVKQNNDIRLKILGITPIAIYAFYHECISLIIGFRKMQVLETMKIYTIFKIVVYAMILITITICLYQIFKKEKNRLKRFMPAYLFCVGVISRYIMAFSPTIYASEERTCLFWYISVSIINLLVIQKMFTKEQIEEREEE